MPETKSPPAFLPLNIAVLTVSDSRHLKDDRSGDVIEARLLKAGHILAARAIVRDELVEIKSLLTKWINDPSINTIIATGGTGITGRDITPEAFQSLYDKDIPGFGELFRMLSYQKIGTSTIQSRATAGIANGTILFALPGSPSACNDAWDLILDTQLDIRHKPCNFAELLPRLTER